MKRWISLLAMAMVMVAACGGGGAPPADAPDSPATAGGDAAAMPVQFGLDWTPNTNHTGLYVAQAEGYYADEQLDVEMVQAWESGSVEQLVAAGQLDFGISYQEGVTQARAEGLPVVSVAAIIQHNTSGFLSRADEGITSPADFAGKKYGAFGSPTEAAVIRGLMECAGADFESVEFVEIGTTDFFTASERGDVDFVWVFAGWTGVEADIRDVPVNMVMMTDVADCVPDYYTPVIIASEDTIANDPDKVRRFLAATSAGYQYAIENPEQAATILLDAAPELDADLVQQSQQYLAAQYQADAPRWGEQTTERWQTYAAWMSERDLVPEMITAEAAYTNEFLPAAEE